MYWWSYLKDGPLQVDLDPSVADADKRSDIRKVVIQDAMKTSFGYLDSFLKKLRLIPWLVDLLVSVMDELRQGLLVLDPIGELPNRIDYEKAWDDSVGQVISIIDRVYNGQGESREGHDHEIHEVPNMVARIWLFLLQLEP